METNKEVLYKTMVKQARQTNAKLLRLKGHLGSQYSWAGKRLLDYLSADIVNAVTSKGFVKFNKNMSIAQMRAVIRATEKFLASKTSTPEGVQENIENIKKGIRGSFEVTTKTAENIYKFFGTDEYKNNSEVKYEQLKVASEVVNTGGDFNSFINTLSTYMEVGADVDIKKELEQIYNLAKQEGLDVFKNLNLDGVKM